MKKEMKSNLKGDKKEQGSAVQVSNDTDLMALVKDLQGQLNELKAQKETTVAGEKPIAADDFLEVPVIFFAYSTSFVLSAKDKRRGKYVESPTEDLVKFRKAYRYEKRSNKGRGVDIVSTCTVRVQSKSLAEWLRDHTLFGIKFFESMSEAANVDVSFAEKMSQVQGIISQMSDMQVIERAKTLGGIAISQDVDQVRRAVVEKIAKSEMESDSSRKVAKYVQGQGKKEKTINENAIALGAGQGDVYN